MSDTSSKSSQAEIVELVEFAKVATEENFNMAGAALNAATGQAWAVGGIMHWMSYFQEHTLLRKPKAVAILTKFRHEYTVLKLTR